MLMCLFNLGSKIIRNAQLIVSMVEVSFRLNFGAVK